jgi:8-oxo-dGTP pyrophosphatase MutT (NUDIX family)
MPGESYLAAAIRETEEELGLKDLDLRFLYYSKIRSHIESENVATFLAVAEGPFMFDPVEIDEVKFWAAEEIAAGMGGGLFTPNFEEEWTLYRQWREQQG